MSFRLRPFSSFKRYQVFLMISLVSSVAFGQSVTFDPILRLSKDNPAEDAAIQIPSGKVKVLRINAYDPDNENEGQLFINGKGPIDLFPGGNNGLNNQDADINIILNKEQQQAWFVPGNNILRFRWIRTNGYRINSIVAIDEISVKEYSSVTPVVGASISENRARALEIYRKIGWSDNSH